MVKQVQVKKQLRSASIKPQVGNNRKLVVVLHKHENARDQWLVRLAHVVAAA